MDFYQIELMPTANRDFVFIDQPPEGTYTPKRHRPVVT